MAVYLLFHIRSERDVLRFVAPLASVVGVRHLEAAVMRSHAKRLEVAGKGAGAVSTEDGNVWDRALKALDDSSSHVAERSALKARLAAYVAERSALETKGTIPRGVRRRGERLLAEVSAFEERSDPVADRPAHADASVIEEDGATKAPDAGGRRAKVEGGTKPPWVPRQAHRGTRPPSRGRGG